MALNRNCALICGAANSVEWGVRPVVFWARRIPPHFLFRSGSHTHYCQLFFHDLPGPLEQPVERNQLVRAFSGLLNVKAPAAKIGVLGAEPVALDPPGANVRGRGGAFVEAHG